MLVTETIYAEEEKDNRAAYNSAGLRGRLGRFYYPDY